jgi:hypothetical protein
VARQPAERRQINEFGFVVAVCLFGVTIDIRWLCHVLLVFVISRSGVQVPVLAPEFDISGTWVSTGVSWLRLAIPAQWRSAP